jgi:predicted phage tail protein
MENIIKGWFTSILGAAAMALSLYAWWTDQATNIEAIFAGSCGFALLYMRDKISTWIEQAFKMLMNKFLK